jgi:hypothetical protein
MTDPSMERLIALVQRELKADSVRVLPAGADEAEADNVLFASLPDGRLLAVAFATPPPSKEALVRRLTMLTATFAQSLSEGPRSSSSRLPVSGSLHQELRALAARARAVDAAVIDAQSPVVWGAGSAERDSGAPPRVALVDVSSARLVEEADLSGDANRDDHPREGTEDPLPSLERVRALTETAIERVREIPGLGALRRGGHVAETLRGGDFVALVRSFASIYVLVLVFDAPFDEVRAERAIEDGLPRIERLVLALPPLDPKPAPMAGAISIRRGRRSS